MLERHNNHFTTFDSISKADFAERVIQTLRGKIQKYMTEYKTSNWIDALPDLVRSCNSTAHSSIGTPPNDADKANESKIWFRLFGKEYRPARMEQHVSKIPVGSHVRKQVSKKVFDKAANVTYSPEVFKVVRELKTDPVTY